MKVTSGGAAQAHFLHGPVGGGEAANPEGVVVQRSEEHAILAMPYGYDPQGQDPSRFKGCCAVVGWLDADTVLFFSMSSAARRILAWDVDTDRVYLVSELEGAGYAASFADLSD